MQIKKMEAWKLSMSALQMSVLFKSISIEGKKRMISCEI